jgi:hypothetical protein
MSKPRQAVENARAGRFDRPEYRFGTRKVIQGWWMRCFLAGEPYIVGEKAGPKVAITIDWETAVPYTLSQIGIHRISDLLETIYRDDDNHWPKGTRMMIGAPRSSNNGEPRWFIHPVDPDRTDGILREIVSIIAENRTAYDYDAAWLS